MKAVTSLIIVLAAGGSGACPQSTWHVAPTFQQRLEQLGAGGPMLASCCKICRKGKACGNSCISASYACHKGPGCACDG
ncbi:hypothetical protein E0K93_02315 [Puniceibacterium sp. HSS470]|nr:hypothetical protein [Pseudooceanicola sediminis]KAA2317161.1 hypothetical protein E0K93_02315 [Puniceibacterium sp. HSS470]|tara:strand:+ start:80885 stop:81121 length:237 start_codon:yes stop_codon:yes gene_type:complete